MQPSFKFLRHAKVGQLAVVCLLSACSAILGIEDVQCDPASAACAEGVGAVMNPVVGDGSCDALCTGAANICTDGDRAYTTNVVCLGVCSLLSEEERECRFGELASARDLDEPATHCPAVSIAGTRANGDRACGSSCETFCSLLLQACPEAFGGVPAALETFENEQQCQAACEQLGDATRGFSVQDRSGDTRQCRLWHLAQAILEPLHCEHARGGCPCGPPEVCDATFQ